MLDIQAGFLSKGLFAAWPDVNIVDEALSLWPFLNLEVKHFSCIKLVIWVWLESKRLLSNIVKEKCSVRKDNGNKPYCSFSLCQGSRLWLFSCIFQLFIERVQLNCTIMSISLTFKCGSCIFLLKYHCRLHKTAGAVFLLVLFCHGCHSNNKKSIKIHLIHFLIIYAVMNSHLGSVDSDVWRYLKSTLNTTIPF